MSQLKLYKASAGSGKTYTLALEYIKELLMGEACNYRHILAVTFTKDATGEMKERILSDLYGLAFGTADSKKFLNSVQDALNEDGRSMDDALIRKKAGEILNAIIHDYSRLYITTIDSFFQKVLHNLARELGRGSKFNIEMNSAKVRMEAVNRMIENAHREPQLLQWLTTYVENKLEQDGNWRFKDEVYRFSACIYDEFFQEHETVLRNQLNENSSIFSDIKKHHYTLLREYKTYFKKTYRQVIDLLNESQLDTSDFYLKGSVFDFWKNLAENQRSEIGKTIEKLLTGAENWSTKTHKRRNDIIALAERSLMDLLSDTVRVLQKQDTSNLILGNIHQLGLIWYITEEIGKINTENNNFMLSDTALFLHRMIDASDSPFIYEKIGAEIRHVMIDEFQDTSRLQWSNFKVLLSDILANNRFSMIVGDVKQSIYRWRNGDWRILNQVENELAVWEQSLDFNFRSEKQVVAFNNDFFTEAGQLLDDKYKEELFASIESPFSLAYSKEHVNQKTKGNADGGYVSIDFLQDGETDKYNEVVLSTLLEKIQLLQSSNIRPGDICILVRNNNQIRWIADYFSSQKANNPELAAGNYLNIVSNEAFQLNSSLSVKIIIEALKTRAYPDNPVYKANLEYLLSLTTNGDVTNRHCEEERRSNPVKTDILDCFAPLAMTQPETQNLESLTMPLLELISYLYRLYGLERIEGQSAYLFFFFDAVADYLKDHSTDIHSFLTYWEDELSLKTIPAGEGIEGVRAMTIHKSKGLQFHTVLIPYCTWELNPKKNPIVWCGKKKGFYDLELLPVSYSEKMKNTVFSEEYRHETALSWLDNLNLLYVAFTRAEQNLIIFGKNKKQLASLENIKNVSDLLQWIIPKLNGDWKTDSMHYDAGVLTNIRKAKEETMNPLKQTPPPLYVDFVSGEFLEGKPAFKQSNQSREFIRSDSPSREKYITHGNIMHALFAAIRTPDDIDKAVERFVSDGFILPAEKDNYKNQIRFYIQNPQVKDWFSEKYAVYPEFSIIVKENGTVTTKRPDRVLLSDETTLVIDYKFGEPHRTHEKQMQEYLRLLQTMNYPNVKGFLWYVEKGNVSIC
jgi:ATP-dependent exoDNAse (exonuclease V) beta subunit